ncbi:hypothetical protein GCM10025787_29670 [Saccharopolyspora rosea]
MLERAMSSRRREVDIAQPSITVDVHDDVQVDATHGRRDPLTAADAWHSATRDRRKDLRFGTSGHVSPSKHNNWGSKR